MNKKWKSNKFCGKSAYFSPEVALKKVNFDAKSNDIFCLGVCFFMVCYVFVRVSIVLYLKRDMYIKVLIGSAPWESASIKDPGFVCIMDGKITGLLHQWRKSSFVTKEILQLFHSFFKFEHDRITMTELKGNKWIYPNQNQHETQSAHEEQTENHVEIKEKEMEHKYQDARSEQVSMRMDDECKSNDIMRSCTDKEVHTLAVNLNRSFRKLRKRSLAKDAILALIQHNIMLSKDCNGKLECREYLQELLSNGYVIENKTNLHCITYQLDSNKCRSKSK